MAANERKRTTRRRDLLILLAAGAAALGANRLFNRPIGADYEPVPGLPGFRRLRIGDLSGGIDPFVGLDAPAVRAAEIGNDEVCTALFQKHRAGTVPVASFSDYFCPYCRVLTKELARRHADGLITVTWHELPLLGDASLAAARAALAADAQGAYPEIHARLMRSRAVADASYMRALAESAGLDPGRFVKDAMSPEVDRRIAVSHGLAARFGFVGTPALVVGRIAVLGSITPDRLDALIAEEAGGGGNCAPA